MNNSCTPYYAISSHVDSLSGVNWDCRCPESCIFGEDLDDKQIWGICKRNGCRFVKPRNPLISFYYCLLPREGKPLELSTLRKFIYDGTYRVNEDYFLEEDHFVFYIKCVLKRRQREGKQGVCSTRFEPSEDILFYSYDEIDEIVCSNKKRKHVNDNYGDGDGDIDGDGGMDETTVVDCIALDTQSPATTESDGGTHQLNKKQLLEYMLSNLNRLHERDLIVLIHSASSKLMR